MLFHGNPYLIQGFNTFLPPGYRIELNNDHTDTITVTTPMGQMTQRTTMYGIPTTLAREPGGTPGVAPPYSQPPFGLAPPPVLPVGIGSGSRPVTPIPIHNHPPPHLGAEMQGMRHLLSHSPGLQSGREENSAVSMLNSLNARQTDKQPSGEFHHAINYLNKIKLRYQDDPETYKQFLEILQTYQKEQKHVQDVSVSFLMIVCRPDSSAETSSSASANEANAGVRAGADVVQGRARSHGRVQGLLTRGDGAGRASPGRGGYIASAYGRPWHSGVLHNT